MNMAQLSRAVWTVRYVCGMKRVDGELKPVHDTLSVVGAEHLPAVLAALAPTASIQFTGYIK